MGHIKHDIVIVTLSEVGGMRAKEVVEQFRDALPEAWRPLLIGPISSIVNFDVTYVFLPDGSKSGWGTDRDGDGYRTAFVEIFTSADYADIVQLQYGGDDLDYRIKAERS